jgi:hypothetical protein
MGTLRSDMDHGGLMVNGVMLGEAARDTDDDGLLFGEYRWDDSLLPSGVIEQDGTITLDETEIV